MQQSLGIAANLVGVNDLQFRQQLGQVVVVFAAGDFRLNAAVFVVAVDHVFNRRAFAGIYFLAHLGDLPVGRQPQFPAVVGEFAGEQFKQAGFAAAIGADQGQVFAGVYPQRGRL